MNRAQRRRAAKAGLPVPPKEPTVNIKLSDLGRMTPTQVTAMREEINRQCMEADARLLWTLLRHLGFGPKRLHDFYLAMAEEHRRMREYYQIDDLYPERIKLKELGVDVEAWQNEIS